MPNIASFSDYLEQQVRGYAEMPSEFWAKGVGEQDTDEADGEDDRFGISLVGIPDFDSGVIYIQQVRLIVSSGSLTIYGEFGRHSGFVVGTGQGYESRMEIDAGIASCVYEKFVEDACSQFNRYCSRKDDVKQEGGDLWGFVT